MSAEIKVLAPEPFLSVADEAHHLVAAAAMLALAVRGYVDLGKEEVPGESHGEGLKHGAEYVEDLAENLAARLEGRPRRWITLCWTSPTDPPPGWLKPWVTPPEPPPAPKPEGAGPGLGRAPERPPPRRRRRR